MSSGVFAIINTGGKQFYVRVGAVIEIEKLQAAASEVVHFRDISLISGNGKVISPQNALVTGQIVKHFRGKKLIAFRKHRRTSGFTRKRGHRQSLTAVLIQDINPAVTSQG